MEQRILRLQAGNLHRALARLPLPVVPTPNQCQELIAAALGAPHGAYDMPQVMQRRPDHWSWDLSRAVTRVEGRLAVLKRPDGQRGLTVPREDLTQALAQAWTLTYEQENQLLTQLVPKPAQGALRTALDATSGSFTVQIGPRGIQIDQDGPEGSLIVDPTPVPPSVIEAIRSQLPRMEAGWTHTTGVPGVVSRIWFEEQALSIMVLRDVPTGRPPAALSGTWRTLMVVGGQDETRYSYTRPLIRSFVAEGARVALIGMERWIAGSTLGVAAISPHLRHYAEPDWEVRPSTIDQLCRDRPDIVVWVQPSIYGDDLPHVVRLVRTGIRVVLDTRRWEPNPYQQYVNWAADVTIQF